ncbi:MAG: aminotransferase-like domain-containing protein [Dehalococcoidia bacterium]
MTYNWEQAIAARGKAMEWSPWAQRDLPAPPVPPIQLTGGIPDPGSLPVDDLIACNERVLRREGTFALMYGGPQGYGGLREWLANDVNRREGLHSGAENVVLTCGSAGGLENICEAFLDPGDVAIIERPSFPGSVRTIMSCLPEIVGVPVDDDGLNVDALEEAVARVQAEGKRAKVLYTISNFHNPAAATLSLERRKRIVELCRADNILIIQDDAYGRIGFDETTPPSMYALAGGSGAVLLGTFSKTLATGLRLGWVTGEKPVVDAITRMRFDMGVSPWTSRVVAEFCESGKFDAHVERVIEIYRRKRDAMVAALDERCAGYARWSVPKGGFFLWLELGEGIDPRRLAETANEEAVLYVGGRPFFDDRSGDHFVRLCYSNVAESDIPEAIMRFGRALERAVR